MSEAGPDPSGTGPAFFRRRGFVVAVLLTALFLLLALALVYGLQSRLTFPRASSYALKPQVRVAVGGEAVWLDVNGDRVEAWMLPAETAGRAPLLVHAHGNGEAIDTWAQSVAPLRAAGIAVLLVEYPGYGRSQGDPSEASVAATFVAAFDHAARDPRVDATRIVGYGRSLGGGAIAQLAARRPLAALVLESTFTSVTALVRAHGVPDWLVLNRFETGAVLAKFAKPTLIIHGAQDGNIPVAHAHALRAAAPHARLELLACGHNDCPPQWELVRSFLAENGVCKAPVPEISHEIDAHPPC